MTSPSLKMSDEELQDEELRIRAGREMETIGAYQLTMYLIVSLPLMLSATYSLGYAFTAGEMDYRCLIPECENATNYEWQPAWINDAAPIKDDKIETCTRYVINDNNNNISNTCSASSFTKEEQSCETWVYDPNEKTILNEWDITCNDRWKLAMVGTINNIGQLVGLIFAGYLSDRFGRRAVLTIQTFVSGVIGVIQSFSVNYWMFISFEFLQATASTGMYSSGFILGLEMVGEKRRVLGGTIISCWYALGEMLLGLAAMWLRSWRAMLRLFFIPGLFAIFLPAIIPESIRWLIANGKTSEVEKIYKKMARMNGFEMSEAKISMYKELNAGGVPKVEKKVKSGDRVLTRQALKRPVLVIRLLACFLCWLTNTFVYYGLSLNAVAIAGDKYINFVLVSFVEIPANFLSCFLINRVGRKATVSASFFLSGIFCLAIQFVPAGSDSYIPLVMFLGGKGCITMAFSAIYVYTAEMFPTTARHSLLAMCSMTGRIGSILAPQTRLLASVMQSLPLILFGCMGIIAGFVSLVFPETLGSKLPDTIEEAENIGNVKPKKTTSDCMS